MTSLKGVAASPGVAIGKSFIYHPVQITISRENVAAADRPAEQKAFILGRQRAAASLEKLIDTIRLERGEEFVGVFEGHLEILLDDEISDDVTNRIANGQSALAAISDSFAEQRAAFLALDDPYLQARADDISDIEKRLLRAVTGVDNPDLSDAPQGAVIVAHDLAPSDTARLKPGMIAGFVCETGGPTAHVAIMARSLELPAVVGCSGIMSYVHEQDEIALDGSSGEVVVQPELEQRQHFQARALGFQNEQQKLEVLRSAEALTRDGRRVLLAANIGSPEDAEAAARWRPDGVGLMRTEFLFMSRAEPPSEEEQYQAYAKVARVMKGHPVIIRTMDIGGDKPVPGFNFPTEANPFLGWRGARLFLYDADGSMPNREAVMGGHMRAQIGAILRAATEGEIWLMWPMVTTVEEIDFLATILDEVRADLTAQHISFGPVKVGAMIETPSAAIMADKIAAKVDFLSIGSNDLTQYTLAADRGADRLKPLQAAFHPAVWRLIAQVIEAAHAHGIPVGVCGELAGLEAAALPLLGLKLDEFSMAAPSLLRIKKIIRASNFATAQRVSEKVLSSATASEAQAHAEKALQQLLA